jgi:hypothetical protein
MECGKVSRHEPIESTKGESYKNLVETHFNIQRRLYDYQFSLARTPAELEQRHQAFIQTYNTTAHQGLLNKVKDIRAGVFYPTRFASPQGTLIPLTPEDSVVVSHARPPRRRAPARPPAPQLLLFEVVLTG